MSIRRISFFGGPHFRKSTFAAKLFGDLKTLQYDVENVQECIKERTYTKQFPESFDQVWLLGEQIRREDILLRNGVPLIVTDSPPFITAFYVNYYEYVFSSQMTAIAKYSDEAYESLNIFINIKRDRKTYNSDGRFHSFDESRKIDGDMLYYILKHLGKDNVFVLPAKYSVIRDFVLEKLNG